MTTEENVLHTLQQSNMSITEPRKAVLKFLIEQHRPLTTAEIFESIGERISCNITTIYRMMQKFEEHGLVQKCQLGSGAAYYEYRSPNQHRHHIVCRNCKQIDPVDVCFLQEMEKRLATLGYAEITHSLEFFGICPACQK